MKFGRLLAVFAALVMLSWPVAMPLAEAMPHYGEPISAKMAHDHCADENPGDDTPAGECSFVFLCAQLCAGVMPDLPPKVTVTTLLSRLAPAPALSPDALNHIPPDPPPRLLRMT